MRDGRVWRCAVLLAAMCAGSHLSPAQDFRGSLVGTVNDTTGARMASAEVLLRARSALAAVKEQRAWRISL